MPRAGVTVPRIVAVAGDLADRDGFPAVTLAGIAGELGVSVPSLYRHVDGLDDVRRLLAVQSTFELGTIVTNAAVGRATRDALDSMCDAYRRFGHEHPGRYEATVRAPSPGDSDHRVAAESVVAPVLAVIAGYGLADDQRVHAARMVRSALHGFLHLELSGGFGLPDSVDESFRQLVASVDCALAAWPALG